VRREETWQQPSVDIYPDPYKIIRIQFPVVEELRDTLRETWPSRDALPSTLLILADTFQEAGWHGLAVRMFQEALEFVRLDADQMNLRRTLESLRKSLVELERYEEALPVAEEELALSLELARPGNYSLEIANSAWYSMISLLGKMGKY
jgi:hypothetical protein